MDITLNNWDPENNLHKYIGKTEHKNTGKTQQAKASSPNSLASLFEPGLTPFELRLGYLGNLSLVSTVTITSMEPSFASSGASSLQLRGLNVLHRFRTKQHSEAWVNQKPSTIARKVGGRRLPVRVETPDPLPVEQPIPFIAQDNEHDIDFLLGLARRVGYELYVVPKTKGKPEHLRFEPSNRVVPAQDISLNWGESLIDFKPRLTTANQIAKVTVRGWDRARKKPIKVTVDLKDSEVRRINPDLHRLVEATGGREEITVTEPVFSEADARQRARAIMSDRLKQMVTADGTTIGLPGLRAGSVVEIGSLGASLSGRYFVEKTTHSFSDSGYTTRFTARRESSRRSGS
ncbi:phage late control D family protein [Bradyrhizobium niftali]|uniref:phage late control D family protein n=1 Tax=Bradyrhizobium niftali TaxID=2560055 RepID=UPI00143195D3|nr:contractile injection system protein, VgrG/Pvc8 family [Bradyrhizobium niftali]